MTCVSPRSGIASSGTCRNATTPATAAAATHSRTRNLFLTEKSMMRSIMVRGHFHPALGIDEERARGDDPLTGRQSSRHLYVVADPRAGLDQPRLEVAVAAFDEHRFAHPRVDDRLPWHHEHRREADR